MTQEYDKTIKEGIAETFPNLSKKLLGIEVVQSQPLKDKLQRTTERETDFLQKVITTQGEELIVHLEFQTTDHPKMLERMQLYHALISEKYDLPIAQFVIYLGQNRSKMRSQLPPSRVFNGYTLIEVHELDYYYFLESDIPEDVILAVLGNFDIENAHTILNKIIQRLKELTNSKTTLQKYIYQLLTFARLRDFNITKETLEIMAITYDIEKDALYQKGLKKGEQKGYEKGERKGILNTALKMKKTVFSTQDIMKVTDLTKEQIEKL